MHMCIYAAAAAAVAPMSLSCYCHFSAIIWWPRQCHVIAMVLPCYWHDFKTFASQNSSTLHKLFCFGNGIFRKVCVHAPAPPRGNAVVPPRGENETAAGASSVSSSPSVDGVERGASSKVGCEQTHVWQMTWKRVSYKIETCACMSACMYLFSLVAPSIFNTFTIFQKLSTIVLNCSKLPIIVCNFA